MSNRIRCTTQTALMGVFPMVGVSVFQLEFFHSRGSSCALKTPGDGITLYNADCREVCRRFLKVDAVVTDPPYGINENSRKVASRGKLAAPARLWRLRLGQGAPPRGDRGYSRSVEMAGDLRRQLLRICRRLAACWSGTRWGQQTTSPIVSWHGQICQKQCDASVISGTG